MKTYVVSMTETEMKLFSEFLEQREYARVDYAGLNKSAQAALKSSRNTQAKKLLMTRRKVSISSQQKELGNLMKKSGGYPKHFIEAWTKQEGRPGGPMNKVRDLHYDKALKESTAIKQELRRNAKLK